MKSISKTAKDAGDLARKFSAIIELSELIREIGDIDKYVFECRSKKEKEESLLKSVIKKRESAEKKLSEVEDSIGDAERAARQRAEEIVSAARKEAGEIVARAEARLSSAKMEARKLEDKFKKTSGELSDKECELDKLRGAIEQTKAAIARM